MVFDKGFEEEIYVRDTMLQYRSQGKLELLKNCVVVVAAGDPYLKKSGHIAKVNDDSVGGRTSNMERDHLVRMDGNKQ